MVARARDVGLIKHLNLWGLKTEEKSGWRHRGRPYNFYPRAVIAHHTASDEHSGNFASDRIVSFGRSDLSGPLCHFLLGRDGTVKVISSGYANHAGYGGPHAGIPANLGNTYTWGIEAENNGIGEAWPAGQLNAYYRLCAALLSWMGTTDVSKVFGHKEWTRRKIDPAGINMDRFRAQVRQALNEGPTVRTVSLSKLQPGKRNADILVLKRRLTARGFATNDQKTNFFGKALQNDYRNWQLSLGFRGEDADGVPGKTSLQKLGLRVVA